MNRSSWIIICLIFIIYVFLGITHSGQQGFWHDEIYTFTFLKGISVYDFNDSIWEKIGKSYSTAELQEILKHDHFYTNFDQQILHEGHPPVYFLLLKLWSYFLGISEVSLRGFSLISGVLVIFSLFKIIKEQSKSKHVPWIILVLLLFNPFLFYFFTEARMYSLALLFATLSFIFWIKYIDKREFRDRNFLFFCIFAALLLYTHYYGIFFLTTLAFIEFLKFGFKWRLAKHIFSILFFAPWGFVIKKQMSFHDVHWTDGAVSIYESLNGFLKGIITQLISPMSEPRNYEALVIYFILGIITVIFFKRNRKTAIVGLAVVAFYFIQIYSFDLIFNHHTILISRYYIFLLILFYWAIAKLLDEKRNYLLLASLIIYGFLSINSLVQVFNIDRAPKQMLREVAWYCNDNFDPADCILVIEPQGPLPFALAYYSDKNFKMIAAEEFLKVQDKSAIFIDEMLGVPFRENLLNKDKKKSLDLVPFAGVFVYK